MSLSVDLKAAFDSTDREIDREILIKALRERGVREGLVERRSDERNEEQGKGGKRDE